MNGRGGRERGYRGYERERVGGTKMNGERLRGRGERLRRRGKRLRGRGEKGAEERKETDQKSDIENINLNRT